MVVMIRRLVRSDASGGRYGVGWTVHGCVVAASWLRE
jgi:hypothetical protein